MLDSDNSTYISATRYGLDELKCKDELTMIAGTISHDTLLYRYIVNFFISILNHVLFATL